MKAPRWRGFRNAAIGLTALAMVPTGPASCLAEVPARSTDAAPATAVERALKTTLATGRPTILVVTSGGRPATRQLFQDVLATPKGRDLAREAQVVELPAESAPDAVKYLRVTRFPTILAYRRGANGVELIGREDGVRDQYDAIGYLSTLGIVASGGPPADPDLGRAGHFFHQQVAQASPQGVPAAAPVAPVAPFYQAGPHAVPVVAAPSAPVVAAPAAAPVVISAPSPSIVFQQSAPTVYVAPPPQPANVVILAPPMAAPTVSMIQPSTVAAAAPVSPSLFLAAPAAAPVAAAPVAAAPVMSMPVAPAAFAAMPVAAPAYYQPAAAPVAAAPAAALPTAAIPAGPLGRLIGNFGEKLAKHKYPRVPGATTTPMLAQQSVSPVAVVPAAAPIAAQPQYQYVTPVAPAAAPVAAPVSPQYYPSQPTPQGDGR